MVGMTAHAGVWATIISPPRTSANVKMGIASPTMDRFIEIFLLAVPGLGVTGG
jgi:hypothetical protein